MTNFITGQPVKGTEKKHVPFGSVHVLMTNPPFGSEIPITGPAIGDACEAFRKKNPEPGA